MFPNDLPDYPYLEALYRKNNYGQPCVWFARAISPDSIEIFHGIVGKKINHEIVDTNRRASDEVKSRINSKRKAGYKYLSELKDNNTLPVEGELLNYLNSYLSDNRTTSDGAFLPMLAKLYNPNIFKRTSYFIGQWKINGLRCLISAVRRNDMFNPYDLIFQSREGEYWKSLNNLKEYLLEALPQNLLEAMVEEYYVLDGEVYLPGYTVNQIDHFVKDANCPENKLLQFWCYDLAIEDMVQYERLDTLADYCYKYSCTYSSKEEHLNNKERFVVLPDITITSDSVATQARDRFIELGFEGLILRKPNEEYQFGKRNTTMNKYKNSTDGKFIILDIYPEGVKRKNIPLFKCKNDINDGIFECHVGGSHSYQESILKDKDKYIGKYMYVEYGERSGVNKVPFHIKKTYIIEDK